MLKRPGRWLLAATTIGLMACFVGNAQPAEAARPVSLFVAKGRWDPVLTQERPVPRRERPTRTYRPLPP